MRHRPSCRRASDRGDEPSDTGLSRRLPTMPKRSHAAPGPSAGYGYQIERALYWLSHSPAGAAVGIETDDDVAVRNGTTSLLEQDKHSIAAGAEPFGDRSKDLWNTLNIWLDVHVMNGLNPPRIEGSGWIACWKRSMTMRTSRSFSAY